MGPLLVLRTGVVQYLRELYELIEANYRPGETVLVAHPLDLSSRIFQEKHGAPLASAVLAPLMFRSFYETPKFSSMLTANWVPRWLRRFQFWVADRFVVDPLLGPTINSLRQELGLKTPVKCIFRDWCFSPQLVLGLFPEWFAPTQPDWPPQVALTGFPLWDQPDKAGLPAEVDEFLRGRRGADRFHAWLGRWPMAKSFFRRRLRLASRSVRRGIFMTKYPQQLPSALPVGVRHFSFVPFSQLLPRAAALVHHGGIGTSAQGLAAGFAAAANADGL